MNAYKNSLCLNHVQKDEDDCNHRIEVDYHTFETSIIKLQSSLKKENQSEFQAKRKNTVIFQNPFSKMSKAKKNENRDNGIKLQTHQVHEDGAEFVNIDYIQHNKEESVFVLSVINYDGFVRKKSFIIVHRNKEEMEDLLYQSATNEQRT